MLAAPTLLLALLLLGGAAFAQTGPRTVQPGPPGSETKALDAVEASQLDRPGHTAADVRFMRDMIEHHLQAVEVTALVADRGASEDVRRLAQRIEASQEAEIQWMKRWLAARGEDQPAGDHHHHHHHSMPGMLSPAQLARLEAARGADFDRLFLEYMIFHHEGALVMVEQLFSSGGGQETGIFAFASHVDSDQRIEIERMLTLLASIQPDTE